MGSYNGFATGAAIVLVLFILLVIILVASIRGRYSAIRLMAPEVVQFAAY
ncbi:hypothetical protein [Chengkuizengella sediminis]|nr:hypothetical protein [Chengkuizengella sediminis]NDI35666.1 hypothetical protein [Chengkuizengella sediminis]